MSLLKIGLTGVDDSRWVLSGQGSESSPVRMTAGAVGDLIEAPVTVTTRQTTAAGAQYQGHHVDERYIVLNLLTYSRQSTQEWLRMDAAFRAALAYDQDATLWVQSEESGERRIRVRLSEAPSYERETDPAQDATALWTVTLVALDPYWEGPTYHDEVVFNGENFIDSVTVMNPGDVPAYPKWVLTAPARWALPNPVWDEEVQDLNRLMWFPMQMPGRDVLVDTDPHQEMVAASDDDGAGLWAQMAGQLFEGPVPPRQRMVPLPVHVDPVPWLPWIVPDELRAFLAQRVRDRAREIGLAKFYDMSTDEIGKLIATEIKNAGEKYWNWLSLDVVSWLIDLNSNIIGKQLAAVYGSTLRPLLGATAQVRLTTRWIRPFGGE